jgi:hypothetical protein
MIVFYPVNPVIPSKVILSLNATHQRQSARAAGTLSDCMRGVRMSSPMP